LVSETFHRPSFEQAFPPRAPDAEAAMREGIAERRAKKAMERAEKIQRELAGQNRGQHLARRRRREYSKEEQEAKIELNKYQLQHERQQKFERANKRREEAAERREALQQHLKFLKGEGDEIASWRETHRANIFGKHKGREPRISDESTFPKPEGYDDMLNVQDFFDSALEGDYEPDGETKAAMQELLKGDAEPLTVEAIEEMLGSGTYPQLHGADSALAQKIEGDEEGGRATRQAITAAKVIHESRKLAARGKEGSEEGGTERDFGLRYEGERRRVAPGDERTRGSLLVPTQRESAIVSQHRKEHTVTLRLSFI